MNREDSLQFVQERLRHNNAPALARQLRVRAPARVTRRFVVQLGKGEDHVFERVDRSVCIRCAEGSAWITHDGDPKDVILSRGETYRAEREDAMHLYALQPCVLEIEFADTVVRH